MLSGMRKDKQFGEKVRLFIAGNVDMYANSIVRDCVPQGEYIETLGMGAEKLVLLYKDMLLNQRRVLNIRLPDLTTETEKRFIRSTRIMTTISDGELSKGKIPPFPLIYDVRETPSFFTCEYIKGSTLRSYIEHNGKNLCLNDKMSIFCKIGMGLQLLHDYGVVHRDLKPDNIIIHENGEPKLIDFGIALSCYENVLTRTDAILGTPGYAAPEQLQDAGNVDARAEIFALAKVFYYIVVQDEEFAPEKLPIELLCIIPKAWQEDVERRPSSVSDFLQEIADAYPDLNLFDKKSYTVKDLSVAKAFSDLVVLFGGNTGKVKKLLNVNMVEWDTLMGMAKANIVATH